MILVYNKYLETIFNNCVRIYGDLQQFSKYSIQWNYIIHPLSDYLEIFRVDIYNLDDKLLHEYMVELFRIYFCWVVYVIKDRTANIQGFLILTTRHFLYTILTKNVFQQLCYLFFSLLSFREQFFIWGLYPIFNVKFDWVEHDFILQNHLGNISKNYVRIIGDFRPFII